jgi:hypothetical protein
LLAAAGLLRDFRLIKFALPENRRLIPQSLFASTPTTPLGSSASNLVLGVRTYVPGTAPYVVAALLLCLSPTWAAVFVAAAGFGVGRFMMVA